MIEQDRGGLFVFLDRRAAARMLGAPLPAAAGDLHFLRWQPSGDLAYWEALIRFDAPREDYLALIRQLGLAPFAASGPTVHLPIDWAPPPELSAPDWWTPSPQTPADAAAGPLGAYGSLALKWEGGRVYGRLVDTGEATPGPGT